MDQSIIRILIFVTVYGLFALNGFVAWATYTTSWIFLGFVPVVLALDIVVFVKVREDW